MTIKLKVHNVKTGERVIVIGECEIDPHNWIAQWLAEHGKYYVGEEVAVDSLGFKPLDQELKLFDDELLEAHRVPIGIYATEAYRRAKRYRIDKRYAGHMNIPKWSKNAPNGPKIGEAEDTKNGVPDARRRSGKKTNKR